MGVSSINCYPDRWTCLDLGAPYFGVTNLKEDSTLKDDKVQVWYWFLEGMIWMMFHEARTNVVLGRKSHQSQDTWSEMSRHIGVSENGLYPQLWPSIGKGSSSNGIGGIFRQENTSWCWGEINVYNYATLTSISGDMGQKKTMVQYKPLVVVPHPRQYLWRNPADVSPRNISGKVEYESWWRIVDRWLWLTTDILQMLQPKPPIVKDIFSKRKPHCFFDLVEGKFFAGLFFVYPASVMFFLCWPC